MVLRNGRRTALLNKALEVLEEDVKLLVREASVQERKIMGEVSKFVALFLTVSLLVMILLISDPGYVEQAILGVLSIICADLDLSSVYVPGVFRWP